jgi:hypothetical protein
MTTEKERPTTREILIENIIDDLNGRTIPEAIKFLDFIYKENCNGRQDQYEKIFLDIDWETELLKISFTSFRGAC